MERIMEQGRNDIPGSRWTVEPAQRHPEQEEEDEDNNNNNSEPQFMHTASKIQREIN